MPNADQGAVIYDAQYQNAGKLIVSYCLELNEMIDSYCNCMQKITELAIKDQLICSRLMKVCTRMSELKEPLIQVTDAVKQNCGAYIRDIDSADQFLY